MLFASDEINEQDFPDAVPYYFLYFLIRENRTFGKLTKKCSLACYIPDSKWKNTRVGFIILIMHL